MSALAHGDAVAANGATAPRVSLESMEAKVFAEHYFTAGEALTALGVDDADPALNILTICVIVTTSGWTLLGKSAPASPENFDPEKGKVFAREDALRQLWPLEGYLLRDRLAAEEETPS